MKIFRLVAVLLGSYSLLPAPLQAASPPGRMMQASSPVVYAEDPLTTARRELEIAKTRLRLYVTVDYRLQIRRLETAVKLARAELDFARRREAELTRFRHTRAFDVSIDEARLSAYAASLKLEDHKHELHLLRKTRGEKRRLLELEAEQAAQHVGFLQRVLAEDVRQRESIRIETF